jgi:hypothetical protein
MPLAIAAYYVAGLMLFGYLRHRDRSLLLVQSFLAFLFLAFVGALDWKAPSFEFLPMVLSIGFAVFAFGALVINNRGFIVGAIDFSVYCLFAVAVGGLAFIVKLDVIGTDVIGGLRVEYYLRYAAEIEFLVNHVVNILLVVGSAIVAVIVLVFGGQLWRHEKIEYGLAHGQDTRRAIAMMAAYIMVAVSVGVWVLAPLVGKLSIIRSFLK